MSKIPGRLITYCSNIHPGEGWAETFTALRQHIPAVKAAVSPNHAFPIGLRLSHRAAVELSPEENRRFTDWLRENDCFVPTLNGFPYGSFHGERVKEKVYLPDWRSPQRAAYTMRLADLLAGWLPEGMAGSISTVPIGIKGGGSDGDPGAVRQQILAVLTHLQALRRERGARIVLALEPEPGCLLETTEEVCDFFAALELPPDVRDLLGVCYDCCHQAVEFEEPADSLARLAAAGVRIAKVQVSSALRLLAPAAQALRGCETIGTSDSIRHSGVSRNPGRTADIDEDNRIDELDPGIRRGDERPNRAVMNFSQALRNFDEPCYLHQVVVRNRSGDLSRYQDLPEAIERHPVEAGEEWRCHFHVPIFVAQAGAHGTTRAFLEEILPLLPPELLLEVETYTWEVLPAELRNGSVTASIIRELQWLGAQLDAPHGCS